MYSELDEIILRQYIDTTQIYQSLQVALVRAQNYRGSMFWQSTGNKEYLYRKYDDNLTKSLGIRDEKNEGILAAFKIGKQEANLRLKKMQENMELQRRVNVAMRVGRTPNIVISLLDTFKRAGLQSNFLIVGTNALYAYETYAGVRFNGGITATADVDLLWDSRKKLTLLSDVDDEQFNQSGLLGLVQKIDSSFQLEDSKYRAVNSKGYMIDLIKPRSKSFFDDKESSQLRKNPDDFYAAKIVEMSWLLSAPRLTVPVVGINGAIAEMPTINPIAFALFKAYLSQKEDREAFKRPRDLSQAKAVFSLAKRLPHLNCEIPSIPDSLKNKALEILKSVTPCSYCGQAGCSGGCGGGSVLGM